MSARFQDREHCAGQAKIGGSRDCQRRDRAVHAIDAQQRRTN
jgi:hypothetical protein